MRYSDLYYASIRNLKNCLNKIPPETNPALDIQIIIEKAFKLNRSQFWLKKNDPITEKNHLATFFRYLKRLERAEPVAYILREKIFFSERFYINRNVLIPRPETEILVEKAIENIKSSADILDIGAGSGNISIILAKLTNSRVLATEINSQTLYVFKKNIELHRLKAKVIPRKADLFPNQYQQFDMIVSNPPYLSEDEWQQLPVSIKEYEPKTALVSGERGDEIISRIVKHSKNYLKPGGLLLLEIGYNQKKNVHELLKNADYKDINFFKDYNKIFRIARARK